MARTKKTVIKHREFLPWIEKYRPKNMDEIAHQSHVVSTLKNTVKTCNLTHLLFYGPAGTGKTSTILALARTLYGPNLMKSRVLELNASDERGINVVRTKIKTFAQFTVHKNHKERGYPCPPYKIIILDEADSMTRDAQTALRRTMEKYSNITRFVLICNYVSRIIAPVASRCSKFRFQPLSKVSMFNKLSEIAQSERICIDKEVIEDVIAMSNGDMRKSITLMQSASQMKAENEQVTLSDVYTVSVRVPHNIVSETIITACLSTSFEKVNDVTHHIICEGYPVSLILPILLDVVMKDEAKFSNLAKAAIAHKLALADKKLVDGASEFLQLLDVLACVSKNITR